jgi:hypothetical protein
MRLRLTAAVAFACAAVLLPIASSSSGAGGRVAVPAGFFGVAPQTTLTAEDARFMKAGGIETVRLPMFWPEIQPTAQGPYNWSGFDKSIAVAAAAGLRVLPSIGNTPHWLARKETTLPVNNAKQRAAWSAFLEAAVNRYGPGGEFWIERRQEVNYEPAIPLAVPISEWQIWNEPNFFYFAFPVSPSRYAKLVTISSKAIKAARPGAKVILAGLFGNPDEGGRRGIDAVKFLAALYRVHGIKRYFDGVALHPYAFHVDDLEALTEEVREVVLANHDPGAGLYVTEMGWGSQNDSKIVAFEQGIAGQARELRKAYHFLIANRASLNLKATYWYSWKDNPEYTACSFCDSVGLFRAGSRFRPKPAWRAFVAITGGRARP